MGENDDDPAGEDNKTRTQRQLIELLNELRVVIPGVQVLFAFLLAIPFSQRFGEVDDFQQTVYFATLLLTTVASVLFMAPSAYHRVLFHQHDRRQIIEVSNRLAIAGLAVLSLAMTGAVLLVTDFLYASRVLVIATTGIVFLGFVVLWGVLPLVRRRNVRRRRAAER